MELLIPIKHIIFVPIKSFERKQLIVFPVTIHKRDLEAKA